MGRWKRRKRRGRLQFYRGEGSVKIIIIVEF
jgi:hypothetical protein